MEEEVELIPLHIQLLSTVKQSSIGKKNVKRYSSESLRGTRDIITIQHDQYAHNINLLHISSFLLFFLILLKNVQLRVNMDAYLDMHHLLLQFCCF